MGGNESAEVRFDMTLLSRTPRVALAISYLCAAGCGFKPNVTAPTNGVPAVSLRFGSLVNSDGTRIKDAVVVVQGDRIIHVGHGAGSILAGTRVIDLTRYT